MNENREKQCLGENIWGNKGGKKRIGCFSLHEHKGVKEASRPWSGQAVVVRSKKTHTWHLL